jgi:hypothetical protein
MNLFSEFVATSSDSASRFDDPNIAWAQSIELSIRGMRDAARWMLGVVAGWFILVPQLTGLRQLVPENQPVETVYLSAALLALSVWRILITVLEVQAPSKTTTYEPRNLSQRDLEYVQDWGIMVNPPGPEEWQRAAEIDAFVWAAVRHLTPKEAQKWATGLTPDSTTKAPLPTKADLMQFGERVYWRRMEEIWAVLLLSQRDMARRFAVAKTTLLGFGFLATIALVILSGPPAP